MLLTIVFLYFFKTFLACIGEYSGSQRKNQNSDQNLTEKDCQNVVYLKQNCKFADFIKVVFLKANIFFYRK